MTLRYRDTRISEPVLYFPKGVLEDPFPATAVALHDTGMAALTVWMDGMWRTRHSVFHKDAQKHKDDPRFAFQHGMWMSPDEYEAELGKESKAKSKKTETAKVV